MQNKNEQKSTESTVGYTGRGEGMQGIDKAPGEETPQGNDDTLHEAQKGKNKVDGNPTQKSDQPIGQL